MRWLGLLMLVGCWGNPQIIYREKIVVRTVTVHDTRACSMPDWPPITLVGDSPRYVGKLSAWFYQAAACLGIGDQIYDIRWLVQTVP